MVNTLTFLVFSMNPQNQDMILGTGSALKQTEPTRGSTYSSPPLFSLCRFIKQKQYWHTSFLVWNN